MTALSLNNLKPAAGSTKRKKRVGRGNASGHGTYSTRGLKGQRARAGGRGGLKLFGMKARIQKIPKLRGFKSPYAEAAEVNLSALEKHCREGEIVSPRRLVQLGLVERGQKKVKILATGNLKKKLTIKGCLASATAKAMIEKAGGTIA